MATQLNKKAVTNIMNKRVLIDSRLIGRKVLLTIATDGSAPQDVKDKDGNYVMSVVNEGVGFQIVIFNLQAASGIALSNPLFKQLAAEGLAAERAGNLQEAHDKFNEFLNKTQISFSVPTTAKVLDKLAAGVDISAKIIKIDGPNGSLLSIDPSSITVMAPVVAPSMSFSFDEEEETVPPVNTETAAGALKA